MHRKERAVVGGTGFGMRFVQVDHAGVHFGVEGVVFAVAEGFRHDEDLVVPELDGEAVALDALRPVGERVTIRASFSHRCIRRHLY